MLEIRPTCENCNCPLPVDSTEARICSFECTFCSSCVEQILENVCPNCGGGFEKRPVRPKNTLEKNPASSKTVHKPAQLEAFLPLKEKNKSISPENR